MSVESTIEDLDIVQNFWRGFDCKCDSDVGFTCEKCFTEWTILGAKNNLIKLQNRVKELEEERRWRDYEKEKPKFPDEARKAVYIVKGGDKFLWNLTGFEIEEVNPKDEVKNG